MKKVLISGLIFVLAMIGLITFCFAGYSSYSDVGNEGDLAMFAKKKSSLFLGVTSTGKQLEIGGSTIYKPTATCLYHTQSTVSGAISKSIVRYIIDVNGADISLNGTAKTVDETKVLKLGYAIYAAYNVNNYTNTDNARKQYLRDLLFELLDSWKPSGFYRSKSNSITDAMRNSDGYKAVSDAATAYANKYKGKVVPTKQTTTPTIDTEKQYIGPFKVKYGGHAVNSVKLSLNGGSYTDVILYKNKSGDAYDNKKVPNNTNFYVKCNSNTTSYKLRIQFSRVDYIGKVLLVGNDLATGQNLAVYSAQKKTKKKTIVWGGEEEEKGKLTIYKVDEDTDAGLQGAKFTITGPDGYGGEVETNANGTIVLEDLAPGDYYITETGAPSGYNINLQNTETVTVHIEADDEEEKIFTNKQYGDLQIVKVDIGGTNVINRAGFQFKIFYVDAEGKYQYIGAGSQFSDENSPAQLYYTEDASQAYVFQTNTGGVTDVLRNIPLGTYYVTEVGIPQELVGYYDVDSNPRGVTVTNNVSDTARVVTYVYYENIPKNISIDGYVWIDSYQDNKINTRNNLLDSGEGLAGYPVELYVLVNNSPVVVATTYTDAYGRYEFKYVDYNTLMQGGFFVRILYDAIQYQSVDPNVAAANGAKAVEATADRNWVNAFNTINPAGNSSVYITNNLMEKLEVGYHSVDNHKKEPNHSGINMVSSTQVTGYTLQDKVNNDNGIRYVKNVNFGIYRIPQTDLAIGHDLDSVTVGINDYWHIYNYGSRNYDDGNAWNVGVRFQDNYTGTYKRAIYKSDIEYLKDEPESDKQLQVYLTYKIVLKNESPYYARINNIIEYFDKNYSIDKVGKGIDEYKNITDEITKSPSGESNNYNKYIINTNTRIDPGSSQNIYIKFKLNRAAVETIVNSNVTLNAVAEINSYTVYKDAQDSPIAVLDIDSVPGNAVPGNVNTYEDDTEGAPPVQLVNGGNRTLSGKVFVDRTSGELKTGEIRKGDGKYTDGEAGVKGVNVTLHEMNNYIGDITVSTNENGDFSLSGYIPGQYQLKYTWGDSTYTVQNYKGTIYDSSRNQNNMYWYKDDVDTRKTDAIDDYELRKQIDAQTAEIDNTIYDKITNTYKGNEQSVITKMNSTTPKMEFGVEYEAGATNGNDATTFAIRNVDFGIVERARQQLDMRKRISKLRIKLANEQILADAEVNEDGTLRGQTNYLTYMGPSLINNISDNGFLKAEMDNELIEGATLEVTYEIKIVNNSELDYMSEAFYKYGQEEGEIVTLKPSAVVDYLDSDWGFIPSDNPDWKQITIDGLRTLNASKVNDTNFLDDRIILYTESTAEALKPGENVSVTLNVSKLLTTSNDSIFKNDAEVVKVNKPNRPQDHRGSVIKYFPFAPAEDVNIIPSTGENMGYVLITVIFIIALLVLGIGIFIIIKLVL